MKVYKKTFDMAIITVGTIPATRFIKKAGINVDKNDFVTVDKHMKTNIDNIYAIRRYCKSWKHYKRDICNTSSCSS